MDVNCDKRLKLDTIELVEILRSFINERVQELEEVIVCLFHNSLSAFS